eukprot:14281471-Alexandrium_andersonii.AAC.1
MDLRDSGVFPPAWARREQRTGLRRPSLRSPPAPSWGEPPGLRPAPEPRLRAASRPRAKDGPRDFG